MEYKTVLTNLGLARIALALSEASTITLDSIHLGDGGGNPVLEPDASRTTLINEVYSGAINELSISPVSNSVVVVEAVIPSNIGGWSVAEVGIFDSTGAMIAIGNFPQTYKPDDGEGSARDMVIRIYLEVGSDAAPIIEIDPNIAIASRDWVQSNFSLSVLLPGGTTGQIASKASNADGDIEWIDPLAGFNITVDTVEENQTLSGGQTVVNLLVATTEGLSVFIDGIRLRNDEYTINSPTQIELAVGASAGEKLTAAQNEPTGSLDYLRAVNNLNDVENAATARNNLGAAQDALVLKKASNLSDVANAATARNNIGAAQDALVLKKASNLSDVASSAVSRANIGATTLTEVFQALYPVGEIYITRRGGNPSTWLGFGTWVAYGEGRVLAGYNAAESEFNAIDKTGGAKTHQLTINEMPSHTHSLPSSLADGDPDYVELGPDSNPGPGTETGAKGGNQPHNNLPPYITVKFWRRTA